MDKLIVQDIRCFHEKQVVHLAPLTLLVGENSTGKSTFLASARIAWDLGFGLLSPDFNEEPFNFGTFDEIVNFQGGRAGRAKNFTIGFELATSASLRKNSNNILSNFLSLEGTFHKLKGQPELAYLTIQSGDYCLRLDPEKLSAKFKTPSEEKTFDFPFLKQSRSPLGVVNPLRWGIIPILLKHRSSSSERVFESEDLSEINALNSEDIKIIDSLLRPLRFSRSGLRPYTFAPIRSRSKRTYNPIRSIPQPEGEHVPMVLARLSRGDVEKWEMLKGPLEKFGEACGLFTSLEVKQLGKSEGDPFQIRVRLSGLPRNLVDVGYGVSQVLPILVDSILEPDNQFFLMQQPEVHLHPRAQAELGTFLATLAQTQKKKFIIETHSDYLIDRIRMDVRDGKGIAANKVAILYFERDGNNVKIHSIKIDKHGNIDNPPPGYRKFFLEEERRFFEI